MYVDRCTVFLSLYHEYRTGRVLLALLSQRFHFASGGRARGETVAARSHAGVSFPVCACCGSAAASATLLLHRPEAGGRLRCQRTTHAATS
eukprot:277936-Rhodomonas_salina.1